MFMSCVLLASAVQKRPICLGPLEHEAFPTMNVSSTLAEKLAGMVVNLAAVHEVYSVQ
jgi:hypothetical protein